MQVIQKVEHAPTVGARCDGGGGMDEGREERGAGEEQPAHALLVSLQSANEPGLMVIHYTVKFRRI